MNGAELIASERRRQIKEEGFDARHDEQHKAWELADAAMSYLFAYRFPWLADHPQQRPPYWPVLWDMVWWKPTKDPIRSLVKAGALIAAEIDRLMAE